MVVVLEARKNLDICVQGNTTNLLHCPPRNEEKPSSTHDILGHLCASWWNTQHGTTLSAYRGLHLQGCETLATNGLIQFLAHKALPHQDTECIRNHK